MASPDRKPVRNPFPYGIGTVAFGIGFALALVSAWYAYSPILQWSLLGWDSYPLVLSSRVIEPSDLWGSFTEELMDGLYPHAHYYRPITNLTIAADFALWGLDPLGYHVTDLLCSAASALCVYALARRHAMSRWAGLLALLFFVHHPVQIEALPVTARRPDALAVLFTLLGLLAYGPGPARSGAAGRAFGAICPALAVSSKEAGIVALPILLAYCFFASGGRTTRDRAIDALRRIAWPTLWFAVALLARLAVLGGMGGPEPTGAAPPGLLEWLSIASALPSVLVVPRPLFGGAVPAGAIALAAYAVLAVGAISVSRQARAPTAAAAPPSAFFAFLACWLGAVALLPILSGGFQWWYGIPALPPLALAIASLAQGAWSASRTGHRRRALLLSACLATTYLLPLRYAALVHAYPEWSALDRRQSEFLGKLGVAVAAARPGASLRVTGLPVKQEPLGPLGVQSAWGLSDYSVQAFAALTLPGQRVRVVAGDRLLPGDPSEIRVTVTPKTAVALERSGRPILPER